MLMSGDWDDAMRDSRKERRGKRINKAQSLNARIKRFIYDVDKDYTLNDADKRRVKSEVIKGLFDFSKLMKTPTKKDNN